MTWQEFQSDFATAVLDKIDTDHLGRLSAFTMSASASPAETEKLEEAKRRIRDEIARRRERLARLDEASFRLFERRQVDRQHDEYVAQSSRMHVAQMERSSSSFVFQRRFMWFAVLIAIISALLAWSSLWRQRSETRRDIERIRERLDALEAGDRAHLVR